MWLRNRQNFCRLAKAPRLRDACIRPGAKGGMSKVWQGHDCETPTRRAFESDRLRPRISL
jgi:hypothetical protein